LLYEIAAPGNSQFLHIYFSGFLQKLNHVGSDGSTPSQRITNEG